MLMTTVPDIHPRQTSPIQPSHSIHRFLLGSSLHVHWIHTGVSFPRRDSTSPRSFRGMFIPPYGIVPL